MRMGKHDVVFSAVITVIIVVLVLFCIYPFIICFIISISDESTVITKGFTLTPKVYSLEAYRYIFSPSALGRNIFRGFGVSILITLAGTFFSMFISTSYAFTVSIKSFKYRNFLNLLCYIPMVFSAGILPWYIVLTKYYRLGDTIFALFVPSLMNLWFVFLLRNFFSAVPAEMYESAQVEGANYFQILFRISLPIARVGVITVSLFYALNYWNDFYLALMFLTNRSLYPLQYYLYNMLSSAEFLSNQSGMFIGVNFRAPLETTKMAMCVITVLPILIVFPFIQRYFVKGLIVGAIKG